jgi:hypothetical protein
LHRCWDGFCIRWHLDQCLGHQCGHVDRRQVHFCLSRQPLQEADLASALAPVSLLLLACSSVSQPPLGRATIGVGIGMSKVAAPVLIQEIAHPRLRPILGSCYQSKLPVLLSSSLVVSHLIDPCDMRLTFEYRGIRSFCLYRIHRRCLAYL